MGRKLVTAALLAAALTLVAAPAANAHGGMDPGESIWYSPFAAQFVASLVGGGAYLIMVWEPRNARRRPSGHEHRKGAGWS